MLTVSNDILTAAGHGEQGLPTDGPVQIGQGVKLEVFLRITILDFDD